jgi:hypothetical protein
MVTISESTHGILYSSRCEAVLTDAETAPKQPLPAVEADDRDYFYYPWGTDNLYPQTVAKKAWGSDQIPALLDWKIKALVSGGLIYGNLQFDENGNEKLVPFSDPDIDAFMFQSALKRFSREAASDYYWFNQVFSELILNEQRTKIATITVQEASFCRFAVQNERTGNIPFVYLFANWEKAPSERETHKIPLLDPYWDPAMSIKNRPETRFMYATAFPTPGKIYYQDAAWHALFNSGWLDIEKAIPEFKRNLMKKQISIKFQIKVPKDYWPSKYPLWDTYSTDERIQKKKDELAAFDDFLAGEKNAGKSFITEYTVNLDGKMHEGWIITPIQDPIKDGAYIEDSQEASAHIMRALSVDPTLVGQGPGRNHGSSGSGSDKRVARDIYLLNAKADQDVILEPLDVVSEFNGWKQKYPNLCWWFRNYMIATLNQINPQNRL